jgi:nucleotide-binding universal stress UspA family protein
MYKRILVPLENSPYDDAIVDHVTALARACGSSLVFIHVADGWAARNISSLQLRESEEMKKDRDYIERIATEAEGDGVDAEALLASGDPASEIWEAATREKCDLIAMATHGHKFVNDVLRGSVANEVRHTSTIPVLLLRGSSHGRPGRTS